MYKNQHTDAFNSISNSNDLREQILSRLNYHITLTGINTN